MKTMDEALAWLYSNRNRVKDIQLKRISFILNDLNLYPSYRVISVAGTNGKGSCSTYLKNIFKNSGYKCGVFTSPFVIKFNERIGINDSLISDSALIKYISFLYDYQKGYQNKFNDSIPFFELTLIMALMYFKDNNIDIAVLECGIGGKHDAVNAIDSDLSIITSVGYDHTDVLGETIGEILLQKLGIARPGKPLVLAMNKFKSLLENYSNENNIRLHNIYDDITEVGVADFTVFKYKNIEYRASMLGEFQAYNASIAIEAARLIDSTISDESIKRSLEEAFLPGRMQIISKDPLVIVDGAHNIDAMINLIISLMHYNKKIKMVFASLKDKDYEEMLEYLKNYVSQFYFTYLDDKRAVDPEIFNSLVGSNGTIVNNINEIKNIEVKANELLVITGSLHFVGKILNEIK